MVKAFIFDLDGTLIDSHELHVASFKPLLLKYKLRIKGRDLKKYFGMIAEDILKKVFPELSERVVNKVVADKRKLFLKNIHLVKESKCATQLLKQLKSKGVLAMVSSSYTGEIKTILKHLGWSDYFSLIIDGYAVAPKPAPDSLLKAVAELNVAKKDCVYIGDSVYDALAARSAGIKFVGVSTGSFSKKHFNELGFNNVYPSLCSMIKNYNVWKP